MTNTVNPIGRSLSELEKVIERGVRTFIEVGEALLEIRERRLYREQGFGTFEDYCEKRWGWHRRYGDRLIDAAVVAHNLSPMGLIPQTERQTRELVPLPPPEQREVWKEAVEQSPTQQPTAREIEAIVRRRIEARHVADSLEECAEPIAIQPVMSQPEYRELKAQMKAGSEWASKVFGIISAIETLSQPPLNMQDAAEQILRFDTPDKDWRTQASRAQANLAELLKGLKS
jgi:hypothetical protein